MVVMDSTEMNVCDKFNGVRIKIMHRNELLDIVITNTYFL